MYRTLLLAFTLAATLIAPTASAAESLADRIEALEPIIGGYPPNISSESEAASVNKRYQALKSELDKLLAAKPDDQQLLFMRGYLQNMGHNLDIPEAWDGADKDLRKLLTLNSGHIPGLITLAELWVNSKPDLAPKAEQLFRAAQCYNKDEPLERAQRGIFFALYYQGKKKEAWLQSEYLKQTWPESEQYRKLNDIARNVMVRSNGGKEMKQDAPVKMAMATCS